MMDWTGNSNSIWKTLGATNHTEQEREQDDFYATDPIAIDKLIASVSIPDNVWECACGNGILSNRLKVYQKNVVSTDLKHRGYGTAGVDFLSTITMPIQSPCAIITNPPYKYAKEFVEHSLNLLNDGDMCCMFLKLTFLEGKASKKLFLEYPPQKVLVFSERILCAKNAEFERMRKSGGSAVAYAWFIWTKGYKGKTVIEWI
jgi:hypothetical protein